MATAHLELEQAVLAQPFHVDAWLALVAAVRAEPAHAAAPLSNAAANAVNRIFARACAAAPRSFKLWRLYLVERRRQLADDPALLDLQIRIAASAALAGVGERGQVAADAAVAPGSAGRRSVLGVPVDRRPAAAASAAGGEQPHRQAEQAPAAASRGGAAAGPPDASALGTATRIRLRFPVGHKAVRAVRALHRDAVAAAPFPRLFLDAIAFERDTVGDLGAAVRIANEALRTLPVTQHRGLWAEGLRPIVANVVTPAPVAIELSRRALAFYSCTDRVASSGSGGAASAEAAAGRVLVPGLGGRGAPLRAHLDHASLLQARGAGALLLAHCAASAQRFGAALAETVEFWDSAVAAMALAAAEAEALMARKR